MNTQNKLLLWIFHNRDNFPLNAGRAFQAYQETEGYQGKQASFSEMISKLQARNLVEKPEYATYDISSRGIKFCLNLLERNTKEFERPENYGAVITEISDYLMMERSDDIADALIQGERFVVSMEALDSSCPEVFDFFQEKPDAFIDAFEEALEENCDDQVPNYRIRPDVDWLKKNIADARNSSKIGEPVIVEGVIKRSEQVTPMIVSAVFECTQCGDRVEKQQDSSQLKSPYKCDCGSKRFEPIDKKYRDVIDFEISHRDEMETTIYARLLGDPDLDAQVQKDLMTGSMVTALGVTREKDFGNNGNDSKKVDCSLEVIDYVRSDKKKDVQEIADEKRQNVLDRVEESSDPFDDFAESIAPGLGDVDLAKKCVAASLIGSPEIEAKGVGSKDYGRIHTAIIANPGLGKSAVLNWVKSTFSKTFIAEGGQGSGTGLTATAEQSRGGEWRLVAGKLVFADRGILGIDEFDKFEEGELTSLNGAMETGFFNVDKASVSAELPGRATIIAAGNFQSRPDGFTNLYELLPEKGEGLYDRFALMCSITESGEKAHDNISSRFKPGESESVDPVFDEDEMRVYRHMMRQCKPLLTDESYAPIKNFISAADNKSGGDLRGESNRFLVNLIKLTLSIARANLRESEATPEDAQKAIQLMRENRQSLGLDMGDRGVATEFKEHRKMQFVLDEHGEICDEDGRADIEELNERCVENGRLSETAFEQIIKKLKEEGEAWEPEQGFLAIV